jgi:hypothetical protein
MPHSLRAKLSGLRYKGILEDKDYKRLCKALDNEDVLEQIRQEIADLKPYAMYTDGMVKKSEILQIIDRHMKG